VTTRLLRLAGWALVTAGSLVLLYLVYTLLYTNVSTDRAPAALRVEWELEVGPPDPPRPPSALAGEHGPQPLAAEQAASPPVVPVGEALAVLEFARPGGGEPPVHAEPLFVVEGVGVEALRRGPGHYPKTSMPGQSGNFAVAGHRSTYGAPFFHLDQLQAGDEVAVTDRTATRHVYRVVGQRVVSPGALSVLDADPLGSGRPTLTLTTCHPRFSNSQRLIVFAELVT
jgi:sortase A